MTNNHFNDNDLLAVLCGYITSAVGQIALFGMEALKAAILGLIGGAAAYLGKRIVEKYLKKPKHG